MRSAAEIMRASKTLEGLAQAPTQAKPSDSPQCTCNFQVDCSGTGVLWCQGCSAVGTTCACPLCRGDGSMNCPGCADCDGTLNDEENFDPDEETPDEEA